VSTSHGKELDSGYLIFGISAVYDGEGGIRLSRATSRENL